MLLQETPLPLLRMPLSPEPLGLLLLLLPLALRCCVPAAAEAAALLHFCSSSSTMLLLLLVPDAIRRRDQTGKGLRFSVTFTPRGQLQCVVQQMRAKVSPRSLALSQLYLFRFSSFKMVAAYGMFFLLFNPIAKKCGCCCWCCCCRRRSWVN